MTTLKQLLTEELQQAFYTNEGVDNNEMAAYYTAKAIIRYISRLMDVENGRISEEVGEALTWAITARISALSNLRLDINEAFNGSISEW